MDNGSLERIQEVNNRSKNQQVVMQTEKRNLALQKSVKLDKEIKAKEKLLQ